MSFFKQFKLTGLFFERLELIAAFFIFFVVTSYFPKFFDVKFFEFTPLLFFIFPLLLIASFLFNYARKNLKVLIEISYTLSICVALFIAYQNDFNSVSFLFFFLAYCFLTFTFRNHISFLCFNVPIVAILLAEYIFFNKPLYYSKSVILLSYFLSFCSGFIITMIRSTTKERYRGRSKLLRHLFNSSKSALILYDRDKDLIADINQIALDLFALESGKEEKLSDLVYHNLDVFKDWDKKQNYSIQTEDHQIIKVSAKPITYKKYNYLLITIDVFNDLLDLSKSDEYQRLQKLSNESYYYLFEKNASLMALLKDNNEIIDLNETFANSLEYEKGDLVGKKLDELLYKQDVDWEFIRSNLNNYHRFFEIVLKTKNNRELSIEIVMTKGKFLGQDVIILNGRNISKRKELEKELNIFYERYKYVTDESSIGFLAADLEGNIIESNIAFEDFLNYSKEEILQLHITDIAPEEDNKKTLKLRSELIDKKLRSGEMVKRYLTKDKKIVYGLFKLLLQRDINDKPQYFFAQVADISEMKNAQRKLEISEKSYRDLFNNSEELLYILDEKNCFIDINKAVIEKYGYERKEIIGQTPALFSAPNLNDLDLIMPQINEVWQGKKFNGLWWAIKKDGSVFPKKMRIDRGFYKGKDVIIATGMDISDSYNYEEKLRREEKRYRNLFERNMAGVYRSSIEGKILECNPAFLSIMGYSQEDYKQAKFDVYDFFISKKTRDELVEKIKNDKYLKGEKIQLVRKDKTKITVLLNSKLFKDEQTSTEYLEGNLIDITKLEKVQNQLEKSEKNYIKLINSASFGVVILRQSRIIFSNQKAANILGYEDKESIIGLKDYDVLLEEDRKMYEQIFKLLTKSKELPFSDYVIRKKDGSLVDVECKPSIIKYEGKNSILFSFLDVSDKKLIEAAKEKIESTEKFNTVLKTQLKEKEVLLKEVHHRVKNNMQIISSILSLQSFNLKNKEMFDILQDSQNRIRSMALIHEKLYSTKDFSNVSFSNYLKDLTQNLINSYDVQKVEPRVSFKLDDVNLTIDQAIPCGLIVNEILSNALKYAFIGIKEPKIDLSLYIDKSNEVTIAIADNGVGLPKAFDLEKLNSLGLQLVETLVDQLEGKLEIESSNGTCFTIRFIRII